MPKTYRGKSNGAIAKSSRGRCSCGRTGVKLLWKNDNDEKCCKNCRKKK